MEKDKFLRENIKKIHLESPYSDFTIRVMNLIYIENEKLSTAQVIKMWFKKSIPYIAAILVFVIVSTILLLTGTSVEPTIINEFLTLLGLKFVSVLRLVSVGLVFGTFGAILILFNRNKHNVRVINI